MKIRNFSILLLSSTLIQTAYALNTGDIAVIGYNTSGSPDSFTIVTLAELPAGTTFFVNDNEIAADGGGTFTDLGEGEASFTVKTGQTIAAGTVITLPWGAAAVSTTTYDYSATTSFGLGNNNEEIHLYEAATITSTTPTTFLFSAKIGTSTSSRPAGLTAGTTFISPTGTASRYKITGATYSGTPSALRTAIGDISNNWEGVAPGATTDWTFTVGAPPANTLTLSVSPSSFLESATNPAATGTVTRSVVDANPLVVTLTSPDTSEVTVPPTATIPANQPSVTFDVSAQNDTLPDGNQIVTLTASAPASTSGTFAVTVQGDGDPAVTALQTGDIAFTAFNADRDAIAFVALDAIPAGEVIYFNDNEWNGSAIGFGGAFNTGEGVVTWTSPAGGVAPGTVVVIDTYDTTPTVNVGAVTGSSGLSATDETIYAFQGTSGTQPGTFLAAIANHTADSIANTNLTSGNTAIYLTSSTDFAEYTAARFGPATFAGFLPIIGNTANWTMNVDGNGSAVIPSSTPPFITGAPAATVTIAAGSTVVEGNSGSTPLVFTVNRSNDTTAFTVNYAITGTASSGSDYTPLANGTLSFAAGSGGLSQTITLDVLGDTTIESNETIVVTLSNVVQTTSTTGLATAASTGTITNDDIIPVTYPPSNSLTATIKGSIGLPGAEIPAFDPVSKRAFAASGLGIQVVDLTNPAAPAALTAITPSSLGVGAITSNDISSVAVRKGSGANPSILAAGIINSPKTNNGHVVFLNAATGALIGFSTVGVVPDHIAFTPDGTKLLVCNEGELSTPQTTVAAAVPDAAQGTVSIIAVNAAGLPGTIQTANFSSFDTQTATLKAAGVRIFDDGVPSTDFEPEYLAISPDGTQAMVTLQEANAVAILDIATATFTSVVALGEKDFSTGKYDFSDQDGAGGSNLTNPTTGNPVFGLYMPDAIASYQVGGQTYYVTANEGDDRNDFLAPDETTTVSNAAYDLDNTNFPNEATLKTPASLGRLTVSNLPGLRGDTDSSAPADDVERILSYGGRSFSIYNSTGTLVFDSGDMVEMIVASQFPALFFDARSDNKGPEPEGVTVAKIGSRTFAFVGLERSHMVLAFDVTVPTAPTFATAFQRTGDTNPEGMVVVEAADSPSGKPLLIVANEDSNTLTVFEIGQPTDYTLQLLHLADGEAGLLASTTAPNLAALVDGFDGTFANTLILAGGDNWLPGPFAAGGTDSSIIPVLNSVSGSTIPLTATLPIAAVDIAMHNIIGVEASAVGNHEFDLGSRVFRDTFIVGGGWVGANFPHVTANLDFTGDADLASRFTNTLDGGTGTLIPDASTLKNRIAPAVVLTKGGEKIGIVGATTQLIESISSPSGTEVEGFPKAPGPNGEFDNMPLLAAQLQPVINEMIAEGIDKIVLMSHLQRLTNERELAKLLTGVDIILGAGSNTRLGDANDVAVAFPGHSADFADTYPIVTSGLDGNPTLIVNTDNEYTYLGRLVADFDADGTVITGNVVDRSTLSGAYASTAANVASAWGVTVGDLETTAFATGTKGNKVRQLTEAVQTVIDVKDGNVAGFTNVYLQGERIAVRNQETNLGNITADANLGMLDAALGGLSETRFLVSLKNGGGIRAQIGTISSPDPLTGTVTLLPPPANPDSTPPKPANGVSQLDIENSLRFNNRLIAFDTTPAGLKAILERGVSLLPNEGRFPQVGGMRFSYDATLATGNRVRNVVLIDEDGQSVAKVVTNGLIDAEAPDNITMVTLTFLAGNSTSVGIEAPGGDGYPMRANGSNFRYLVNSGTVASPVLGLSATLSEDINFNDPTNFAPGTMGEQDATFIYFKGFHPTLATAYATADVPIQNDTRIQNIATRTDTVPAGPFFVNFAGYLDENGYSSVGIGGDSDGDGLGDIVEYFFNLNANSGAGFGNLPAVSTVGADKLLTFTTLDSVSDATGALQFSDDLGISDPWSAPVLNVDYEVVSSTSAGGTTTTTLRLLGSAASKFWRHSVSPF